MSYYKDVTKEIAVNMQELGKFIPDVMTAFSELVSSSSADGVLDKKTKELILSRLRWQTVVMVVLVFIPKNWLMRG